MALNTIGERENKPGAASRELSAHYHNAAQEKMQLAQYLEERGSPEALVENFVEEAEAFEWKARGYAIKGAIQTFTARFGLNLG